MCRSRLRGRPAPKPYCTDECCNKCIRMHARHSAKHPFEHRLLPCNSRAHWVRTPCAGAGRVCGSRGLVGDALALHGPAALLLREAPSARGRAHQHTLQCTLRGLCACLAGSLVPSDAGWKATQECHSPEMSPKTLKFMLPKLPLLFTLGSQRKHSYKLGHVTTICMSCCRQRFPDHGQS